MKHVDTVRPYSRRLRVHVGDARAAFVTSAQRSRRLVPRLGCFSAEIVSTLQRRASTDGLTRCFPAMITAGVCPTLAPPRLQTGYIVFHVKHCSRVGGAERWSGLGVRGLGLPRPVS